MYISDFFIFGTLTEWRCFVTYLSNDPIIVIAASVRRPTPTSCSVVFRVPRNVESCCHYIHRCAHVHVYFAQNNLHVNKRIVEFRRLSLGGSRVNIAITFGTETRMARRGHSIVRKIWRYVYSFWQSTLCFNSSPKPQSTVIISRTIFRIDDFIVYFTVTVLSEWRRTARSSDASRSRVSKRMLCDVTHVIVSSWKVMNRRQNRQQRR